MHPRLTLALMLTMVAVVEAHESLPAYLEINQQKAFVYSVLWKVPAVEGAPPAIAFTTPGGCNSLGETAPPQMPGAIVRTWTMECPGGIAGRKIEIAGLPITLLDALVRIRYRDGSVATRILRPAEPSFIVAVAQHGGADAWGYLRLGVEHILYGVDHLFFVLGLLLIVRGTRLLLKTISAFTIAHTLTLAMATLGVVRVPVAPTEAVIALSIVFLGSELALFQRGQLGLTYRKPWVVAFAFGLLHGFGFAGTLSRIGIPTPEIPKALLLFNCGVELGQVAFVLAFVAFVRSLRDLQLNWPRWAEVSVPYAFGATAACWFIQRCASII
jgi:hydrogenase/urease accessory protein HupE